MLSIVPSSWRSVIINATCRENLVPCASCLRWALTKEHLRCTRRGHLPIRLLDWICAASHLPSSVSCVHSGWLMHLSLGTPVSLPIIKWVLMRVEWLFKSVFLPPCTSNLVEKSLLTELFTLFLGWLGNDLHSGSCISLWCSLKCFETVWNNKRDVIWNKSLLLFVWIRFPEAEFGFALAWDLETTCSYILFC